jgi:hypothetical protein
LLLGFDRETQCELAPLARRRDDGDVTTMQAGQLAREVEAESGAGHVGQLAETAEANEQPAHVLGGDPNPIIGDRHRGEPAIRGKSRDHIAPPRRILDRIVDQIVDDDLQTHQVTHHPELVANGLVKPKPVLCGGRRHGHLHRPTDQFAQIDPLALELRPPILEPRRLHHLVGEQTDLTRRRLQHCYDWTQALRDRPERLIAPEFEQPDADRQCLEDMR